MSGSQVMTINIPAKEQNKYSGYLERNGFVKLQSTKQRIKYGRTFSPSEKYMIRRIQNRLGHSRDITCEVVAEKYSRSSNYRYLYFKNHKPSAGGYYRCIYCGRFFPKDKITIDHIIPVYQAAHTLGARMLMKIAGIDDINSDRNLGAACERCNKKKGKKMGFWLIRGAVGRHELFWVLRFIFWAVICVYGIAYIFVLSKM